MKGIYFEKRENTLSFYDKTGYCILTYYRKQNGFCESLVNCSSVLLEKIKSKFQILISEFKNDKLPISEITCTESGLKGTFEKQFVITSKESAPIILNVKALFATNKGLNFDWVDFLAKKYRVKESDIHFQTVFSIN